MEDSEGDFLILELNTSQSGDYYYSLKMVWWSQKSAYVL